MRVKDLFNLKGKVAIVTGAHAWLGYDMACALAEAGCNIIITSRELSRAKEATDKIANEYKVETLPLTMDQRDYEQVKAMAEEAYKWKGHIDILINNAGGGSGKSEGNLFKRSPEDIVNMINTNLTGVLFCCKEVGKYMVKQGYGKIINIGSIAGIVGRDREMYRKTNKNEQPVDYAAAKAGVIGMTRDLAGLMSPYGVYVNCISPGGFYKDEPEQFVEAYSSRVMLGRMGRMNIDIKGAALFLASPASDYITGHNLVVDGGFSVWK
ncbi:MAG TPA: SDR family oxidoreductase [Clostridiaceae bacterium]|nr:SDR family oxidoreductase [Clostridiaceae bacterium]